MTTETPQPLPYEAAHFPRRPSNNPSAQCCYDAWLFAYQSELGQGRPKWFAHQAAAEAFRALMPDLNSLREIQDFIACIAQGILLGALDSQDSTKLLYAAQVALSAHRGPSKTPKNQAG